MVRPDVARAEGGTIALLVAAPVCLRSLPPAQLARQFRFACGYAERSGCFESGCGMTGRSISWP